MKGKFWLFIFVLFTLIMTIAPTTMAISENDMSISGIGISQDGNKLAVRKGKIMDSIDPRFDVNISVNIQNPLVKNFSRITLFIDLGNQVDEALWEEFYREDTSLTASNTLVYADITLNDTSIKRVRIRISQYTTTNETVRDPDLTNNVMILDISKITVEEDETDFPWYLALIALIPLVVVFTGILVFKLSSRYVAPAALFITIILALIFFKDELGFGEALNKMGGTVAYSALWGGLDYVYAIFGAFFFLKMLEKVGAIDQLKNDFKSISTDKQHQVLLIGFCFALILAAVAPGGSNFVIAAIMLVSLGFNRIGVGVLCLFGNSISSVFGLLGVSIIALKEVTGLALLPISGWIGIYMIVLCIFAPLIMNIVYTEQGPLADFRDPDLKEDIILLMGMGAVYGTLQALVAYFAGPELPTIIAGGATLVFVILYERYVVERKILKKAGKHDLSKRVKADKSSKPRLGLFSRPYFYAMVLMVFLLLATRLVPWINDFLTMDIITLEVPFSSISADKVMKFSPFYSPGTILFITTLTVPLFVKVAARYFPDSEMESTFIEDLTNAEISHLGDAEKEMNILRGMKGQEIGEIPRKKSSEKEKPIPKKISTSLTEEMKKTAEKIKSTKVKDGEKDVSDKKTRSGERGKELKKKKKKKKKKQPKIDTSETATDRDEEGNGDDSNDEDSENESGTMTDRKSNREKRRRSFEARKKKKRKLMNDGGDYEVVFDDDDDDDLDWDESDDDDDMEFDFEDDDELDEDYFQDSTDDSVDKSGEDVQTVRIDVLAHAIRPNRMIKRALLNTAKDVAPILLAIVAFIAMANIMRYFNMTSSIAINIVKLVGDAYVFFIPIIGMSGSALTGSTTTSNVLFGGLHIEAATRLGLPTIKVAAAQVLGSSAGEMISPMNAVVIATAIGLKNQESILIKRLLPTFAFWLLLCTIISVVFVSV